MIHVLNTQYYRAPYLNRWSSVVTRALQAEGLEARTFTPYRTMKYNQADETDRMLQHGILVGEGILWELILETIKPGDTIVACNGYSTLPLVIDTYRRMKGMDIKLITYWENSINIQYSPAWSQRIGLKGKRWSWWERYSFRFSNMNVFRNKREQQTFIEGNVIRNALSSAFTHLPQPYDIILDIGKEYKDTVKEDIVVVSEPIIRGTTDKLFLAYQSDVADKFKIVFAMRDKMTRQEYYELLAKAKVVIHPNKHTYDYTSILEALAFGCCVMVPDVTDPVFEQIIPHDFKYQVDVIAANKVIRMIRARESFLERVETLIQAYSEEIYDACVLMGEQLAASKFDRTPFVNLIKQINES